MGCFEEKSQRKKSQATFKGTVWNPGTYGM
jgi:hypothetical protein